MHRVAGGGLKQPLENRTVAGCNPKQAQRAHSPGPSTVMSNEHYTQFTGTCCSLKRPTPLHLLLIGRPVAEDRSHTLTGSPAGCPAYPRVKGRATYAQICLAPLAADDFADFAGAAHDSGPAVTGQLPRSRRKWDRLGRAE